MNRQLSLHNFNPELDNADFAHALICLLAFISKT